MIEYYVQDNVPCHKSAFALQRLKHNNIHTLNRLGTFSDLNVMENIWNIIDQDLTNYHPRTVNDLQQLVLRLWLKYQLKHVKI